MLQMKAAHHRLIVALDVDRPDQARRIVETLGEEVGFYKIGYQLAYSGGLELARELKSAGKNVFLDLKLLDIDNTVAKGVESVLRLGADMLTIHAYPKAMAAAVAAAKDSSLCLLGVTVLTSMDDGDLREAGYATGATELVRHRARQALEAGMGGIVCAAPEASVVRGIVGGKFAVVTPGIRPAGSAGDDQKRTATPASAIAEGATHLVVGRPITAAGDPLQAARLILEQMRTAL